MSKRVLLSCVLAASSLCGWSSKAVRAVPVLTNGDFEASWTSGAVAPSWNSGQSGADWVWSKDTVNFRGSMAQKVSKSTKNMRTGGA